MANIIPGILISQYVRCKLSDILKECKEYIIDKLNEIINKVLRGNAAEIVEVLDKKIVVEPSFKNPKFSQDSNTIVMKVHAKSNGRIEIVVSNKVYQVPRDKLKAFIAKDLLRELSIELGH